MVFCCFFGCLLTNACLLVTCVVFSVAAEKGDKYMGLEHCQAISDVLGVVVVVHCITQALCAKIANVAMPDAHRREGSLANLRLDECTTDRIEFRPSGKTDVTLRLVHNSSHYQPVLRRQAACENAAVIGRHLHRMWVDEESNEDLRRVTGAAFKGDGDQGHGAHSDDELGEHEEGDLEPGGDGAVSPTLAWFLACSSKHGVRVKNKGNGYCGFFAFADAVAHGQLHRHVLKCPAWSGDDGVSYRICSVQCNPPGAFLAISQANVSETRHSMRHALRYEVSLAEVKKAADVLASHAKGVATLHVASALDPRHPGLLEKEHWLGVGGTDVDYLPSVMCMYLRQWIRKGSQGQPPRIVVLRVEEMSSGDARGPRLTMIHSESHTCVFPALPLSLSLSPSLSLLLRVRLTLSLFLLALDTHIAYLFFSLLCRGPSGTNARTTT